MKKQMEKETILLLYIGGKGMVQIITGEGSRGLKTIKYRTIKSIIIH